MISSIAISSLLILSAHAMPYQPVGTTTPCATATATHEVAPVAATPCDSTSTEEVAPTPYAPQHYDSEQPGDNEYYGTPSPDSSYYDESKAAIPDDSYYEDPAAYTPDESHYQDPAAATPDDSYYHQPYESNTKATSAADDKAYDHSNIISSAIGSSLSGMIIFTVAMLV